jgi:hypothetical protein
MNHEKDDDDPVPDDIAFLVEVIESMPVELPPERLDSIIRNVMKRIAEESQDRPPPPAP